MTRPFLILANQSVRRRAQAWINRAPPGTRVEFIEPSQRTLDQNAKLWAMLGDVSRQVDWYQQKLTPEDWRTVMTASLRKSRVVPGLDGEFVVLGLSTSRMTKAEFSNLLELIAAFGSEHGVVWSDPAERDEMERA